MYRGKAQLLGDLGKIHGGLLDQSLGGTDLQRGKIGQGSAAAVLFAKPVKLGRTEGTGGADLLKGERFVYVFFQIHCQLPELPVLVIPGVGTGWPDSGAGCTLLQKIKEKKLQ